jgi:hypothetical protein
MRSCGYCGGSLEGRRADAKFCGDSCRYAAWVENHPESREQRLQTATRADSGQVARRSSRDGRGTRIYVHPDYPDERILAKARAALRERSPHGQTP